MRGHGLDRAGSGEEQLKGTCKCNQCCRKKQLLFNIIIMSLFLAWLSSRKIASFLGSAILHSVACLAVYIFPHYLIKGKSLGGGASY